MMRSSHWALWLALTSVGCTCGADETALPAQATTETEPVTSVDPEVLLGLEPAVANVVLAEIDGAPLRVLDVARELERVGPSLAPRLADAAARRELVEGLVVDRLLADQARRSGWGDEPEARRAADEQIAHALVAQATADVPVPSDEEARAYFDANPTEFRSPERVTVGLIFTRDRAGGEAGLARIQADTRHRSETWIHVAEAIGFAGPRVQPVQTTGAFAAVPTVGDAYVPEVIRPFAFETTPGELVPELVPYEDGFFIVMVYSRFPPTDLAFDEVREGIRARLQERAVLARTDEIIAEGLAAIHIDEAAMQHVHIPE